MESRVLRLFLAFISLLSYAQVQRVQSSSRRRVLVFGGNGFMGSEVVSRLIAHGDHITIVNRGNWYFDSKQRIKPYVDAHYRCDCDKALRIVCPELLTSGYYDVVLDFSSYTAQQIQQVVDILRDRVGVYIYISSDSIYEVCDKKHKGPSREEDAVRPKSPRKRLKLKKTEEYGHEKLACEEVLRSQRKAGGFPYVALRLPDVIGPRDGSYRFWIYQLWIRVHKAIEHPVHLPLGVADTKFSLVHVEDVAKGVERVLEVGPKAHDQAINLAFEEHFTLKDFLEQIAKQLKVDDIIWLEDEATAWYTYPTVAQGPLDISRARILLEWKPRPWDDALQSLTKHLDDAMTDKSMSDDKEMVLADFMEFHVPEEKSEIFLRKLRDIYGDEVFDGIDLDLGFGKDAMELEGRVGNDTGHTVAATTDDQEVESLDAEVEEEAEVNQDIKSPIKEKESDNKRKPSGEL